MISILSMIDPLAVDPSSVQGVVFIFIALAIGHAVADFPLQGPFLADEKTDTTISQVTLIRNHLPMFGFTH